MGRAERLLWRIYGTAAARVSESGVGDLLPNETYPCSNPWTSILLTFVSMKLFGLFTTARRCPDPDVLAFHSWLGVLRDPSTRHRIRSPRTRRSLLAGLSLIHI